jgi:uncharacterized repeat protein (TIGR01451 family)
MKVLLIRLGVLGTVVALGWITIANGQRSGDGVNPLRAPAATPDDSTAATNEPAAQRPPAADPFGLHTRRAPAATAPGFSDAGGDTIPNAASTGLAPPRNAAAASSSRYAPPPATQPETLPTGPALTAGGFAPAADERVARPAPRADVASRAGNRYSTPSPAAMAAAPAASQEPPRLLRADPSAIPASPIVGAAPNRDNFAAPSANNHVAESSLDGDGTGQPGDAQLEGVQSPQLSIQKFAPKEVQVGKPATFRVVVRNTGTIPACEVEVRDQVPRGARLVGTVPQAKTGVRGELVWTLGTIRPGEEAKVEMQVTPTAEGEIGSVATVHFGADA